MSFLKNSGVTGFTFGLVNASDGSDITSGTVIGYYTLDGGTQATITDTAVHEGQGMWSINLTAAEMNGDIVGLSFTEASAITTHFTIKTVTKLVSDLNDTAATDIVSNGAISTTTGSVDNVTLVTTTTTNTDMRGTDGANTVAPDNTTIGIIDDKVDAIGSITSDTNTRVLGIESDYSKFDFTTDQVIVTTNNDKLGYSILGTKNTLDDLNDISTTDIFTTTMTEDYSADGAEFNLAQGMYLAVQNLQDFSFSGVTQTVNKVDGTTTAATYTLDDAVTPTSKTRST